jgi:hypothetical protein
MDCLVVLLSVFKFYSFRSYCIQRLVGEARLPDMDDINFLGTVCEESIKLLSDICKQWRSYWELNLNHINPLWISKLVGIF